MWFLSEGLPNFNNTSTVYNLGQDREKLNFRDSVSARDHNINNSATQQEIGPTSVSETVFDPVVVECEVPVHSLQCNTVHVYVCV